MPLALLCLPHTSQSREGEINHALVYFPQYRFYDPWGGDCHIQMCLAHFSEI